MEDRGLPVGDSSLVELSRALTSPVPNVREEACESVGPNGEPVPEGGLKERPIPLPPEQQRGYPGR